ncbi:MAG: nucleotide pyrophosphohydrolase [Clostridia bacterium]|nr:nucleotide pyrophosphohydrolase [Clostridia bacterium]
MQDFTINQMQAMQKQLQDKYSAIWEPIQPETGKNKLLWMVEEIGEVAHIIKKNDCEKIMKDADVRKSLVEELADVLMYYNDVMMCYNISAGELKSAYEEKFNKNMIRW